MVGTRSKRKLKDMDTDETNILDAELLEAKAADLESELAESKAYAEKIAEEKNQLIKVMGDYESKIENLMSQVKVLKDKSLPNSVGAATSNNLSGKSKIEAKVSGVKLASDISHIETLKRAAKAGIRTTSIMVDSIKGRNGETARKKTLKYLNDALENQKKQEIVAAVDVDYSSMLPNSISETERIQRMDSDKENSDDEVDEHGQQKKKRARPSEDDSNI